MSNLDERLIQRKMVYELFYHKSILFSEVLQKCKGVEFMFRPNEKSKQNKKDVLCLIAN